MNRKNLANAQLLDPIDDTQTVFSVKQGQGADLPDAPFRSTITPLGVLSTRDNSEIVEVTAKNVDELTVLRGQSGTTPKPFQNDSVIANAIYAEDIDNAGTGDMTAAVYDPANGARQVAFADEIPEIPDPEPGVHIGTDEPSSTDQLWLDTDEETGITGILQLLYPVGSIYMNTINPANPGILLGFGSWSPIVDRFIYGAGSKAAGVTGGSETHTLTKAELPAVGLQIGNAATTASGSGATNNVRNSHPGDFTDTYSRHTENMGEDQPHNNMPPYQVAYMWERTA